MKGQAFPWNRTRKNCSCYFSLISEESISFDIDSASFKNSKGGKLAGVTLNTDIGFHMHVPYIHHTKFNYISRLQNYLHLQQFLKHMSTHERKII